MTSGGEAFAIITPVKANLRWAAVDADFHTLLTARRKRTARIWFQHIDRRTFDGYEPLAFLFVETGH